MQRSRKLVVCSAVLGGSLVFYGCSSNSGNSTATAPEPNATGSANRAKLSSAEGDFVQRAAMDSRAEVELGNVAQQNASSDAVKQFGQRMVQDHSKASKELERLVSKKGIALSKTVDEDQRTDAVKFSKLSGPNFDRAYMREMVDDHKKTLEEFQRQAESAQDPDVRSFAVNSLPNLQDHLRQAQEVMSSLRKK